MKHLMASLLVCSLLALNGCGGDDSDQSGDQQQNDSPSENAQPQASPDPRVGKKISKHGYGWDWAVDWFGVDNSDVESFMCKLIDSPSVHRSHAIGAAIVGGTILGIVAKKSGSLFFGKPVKSQMGHWFWRKVEERSRNISEGAFRGAGLALGCEMALSGAWTPFDGIVGVDFSALSAAMALGFVGSVSMAPTAIKGVESFFKRGPTRMSRTKGLVYNKIVELKKWTRTTELGMGTRYIIAPGLSILGVGSGIGVLIYHKLQNGDPRAPGCDQR